LAKKKQGTECRGLKRGHPRIYPEKEGTIKTFKRKKRRENPEGHTIGPSFRAFGKSGGGKEPWPRCRKNHFN